MQTYEVKAEKNVIERVLSRLSIKTNAPKKDGFSVGVAPEITPSDMAMAAAGYRDPVGQHIIGVLLGDREAFLRMVDALDFMGWMRWKTDRRTGWISLEVHRRICKAVIIEFRDGRQWDEKAFVEFLDIGKQKKGHLIAHYDVLWSALTARSADLSQHLQSRLE